MSPIVYCLLAACSSVHQFIEICEFTRNFVGKIYLVLVNYELRRLKIRYWTYSFHWSCKDDEINRPQRVFAVFSGDPRQRSYGPVSEYPPYSPANNIYGYGYPGSPSDVDTGPRQSRLDICLDNWLFKNLIIAINQLLLSHFSHCPINIAFANYAGTDCYHCFIVLTTVLIANSMIVLWFCDHCISNLFCWLFVFKVNVKRAV